MMIRVGAALTLLASLFSFATVHAVGETWSPLGSGMDKEVYALAFDSNGNLYVGGSFTTAGGVTANRIAKWDGTSWSALGSGVNDGDVSALAVDDDSGNLYVGGSFTTADGDVTVNHIAKWDGTSWSALSSGVNGGDVYALAFDSSGNLYVGGSFTSAGGVTANRIAKWDGTSWSALGSGTGVRIYALAFDSTGNLFAGGSFKAAGGVDDTSHVAKWDGTDWSALDSGTSSTVRALAVDNSGNLYAGGDFVTAGGMDAIRIAKWDGTDWSALGSGMGGTSKDVYALAIGSSGNLYAGGKFTTAGDISASHIARWTAPGIAPTTGSSLFCTGESTTISISLSDVVALFGYQFIVNYDHNLVNASAAFINTFFNTNSNAKIPPDWNAVCNEGQCKFAVTKLAPGEPVTGSGAVAQITLTGVKAGTFDLTLSADILSDRDAQAMQHTAGSLPLTVCGFAAVSGTVSLQGRDTPINAGQVTLTDLGGHFGPYSANFDPTTGAFTISSVKVMPGGSNYQFDAAHSLYLGNRTTHTLNPLENYTAPATRLLGGDANNDGSIEISDLTCIGGSFGGATGSSDVNADGAVNILDLVLSGGNYGLTSP